MKKYLVKIYNGSYVSKSYFVSLRNALKKSYLGMDKALSVSVFKRVDDSWVELFVSRGTTHFYNN